jgi:hypothetical protein
MTNPLLGLRKSVGAPAKHRTEFPVSGFVSNAFEGEKLKNDLLFTGSA